MATFNGNNIFGLSVSMPSEMNPVAEQINTFFGLNGLQSLYGGYRGRVFLVAGVMFGTTLANLNAAISAYESNVNGQGGTLVDNNGRTYTPAILRPMRPKGRILQDFAGFYQPYTAEILGL